MVDGGFRVLRRKNLMDSMTIGTRGSRGVPFGNGFSVDAFLVNRDGTRKRNSVFGEHAGIGMT
jgi:hypothetical protein